jgi:hypothetical protein
MDKKLLLALGVIGVLGYSYYAHLQKMKKKPLVDKAKSIQEATEIEKTKYTNAFLTQYDIILPPVQASKIVKAEGFGLQDNRIALENERRAAKKPMYI